MQGGSGKAKGISLKFVASRHSNASKAGAKIAELAVKRGKLGRQAVKKDIDAQQRGEAIGESIDSLKKALALRTPQKAPVVTKREKAPPEKQYKKRYPTHWWDNSGRWGWK
jgi:hypothetical protein